MPPRHQTRVALLVDTSVSFSSQVIRGVARFAREQPGWQLLVQPRGVDEHSGVPGHWRVDGVIARVTHASLARSLRRLRVPVVNISRSVVPGYRFPQVVVDEQAMARLAAEHLLERGLRSLAYYAVPRQPNYADQMGPAFAAAAAAGGAACVRFTARRAPRGPSGELAHWLRALPRPVGVLAWDAEHGYLVREACVTAQLRVPDDVAIVSGEDDELLCTIAYPPLSAVDCGSDRVGYQAAALLARRLKGHMREASLRVAPRGVLARHSTDLLAMEDRDLAAALRILRQQAHGPLTIRDLLRQVPLSRRSLELRFRAALGRSPAAELRRLRVAKAQQLLRDTTWTIPKVAAASGFSQAEVMNRVFRRALHQTPTEYRRRAQSGLETHVAGRHVEAPTRKPARAGRGARGPCPAEGFLAKK